MLIFDVLKSLPVFISDNTVVYDVIDKWPMNDMNYTDKTAFTRPNKTKVLIFALSTI